LSQAPLRKFDGLPCFVEGAGDLVEPVVEQVAIGVEGHRGRGVTEHLLDHLDVGTTGDPETGRGVAELVRVQAGKADRSSGCVEVTASEMGRADRAAAADGGKDQIRRRLALHQRRELFGQEVRKRDLASRMRLRCRPDEALPLHDGDGLRGQRPASRQIEPSDLERSHFAEPDPGVGQEQDDQAVDLAVPLGVGTMLAECGGVAALDGQVLDLRNAEVALLGTDRARQIDLLRDVPCESTVADGEVEDQAQNAMDLPYRGRGASCRQSADPGLDVSVTDVRQLHLPPGGKNVLAQDACVALVGGGLELGLSREPDLGPLPQRDTRQCRVDVRAGVLGGVDRGQEPLGVDLTTGTTWRAFLFASETPAASTNDLALTSLFGRGGAHWRHWLLRLVPSCRGASRISRSRGREGGVTSAVTLMIRPIVGPSDRCQERVTSMFRSRFALIVGGALVLAMAGAAAAAVQGQGDAGKSSNLAAANASYPQQSFDDAVKDTEGGLDADWFINVSLEQQSGADGKVDPSLAPSMRVNIKAPSKDQGGEVTAEWEAMVLEGAVADRMAGDAAHLQDVIGNESTVITLPDGTTDDVGGGAGYVVSGERFSAETSGLSDEVIRRNVADALSKFGLTSINVRVLHPLGPAVFVTATTSQPDDVASRIDDIQNAFLGTSPDLNYEASYLEIDDAQGTPLARVGNALRNGGGISWISPTLQAPSKY
jgi:hypothetical protein